MPKHAQSLRQTWMGGGLVENLIHQWWDVSQLCLVNMHPVHVIVWSLCCPNMHEKQAQRSLSSAERTLGGGVSAMLELGAVVKAPKSWNKEDTSVQWVA